MPHCNQPFKGHHDRVIAVMGATGTGKSTFINLVTGDDKIVVGHGTESKTEFVDASCFLDPDTHLSTMIVDTPGFDDSQRSDVDVLKTITEFLVNSVGGRKLNGIIYMHRISDPRTGGVAKKNLRMFKELCGEKTLAKVVIVTTNWSRVGKEEGDDRENELKKGFFKPLLEEGACIFRHDNSVKSALTILSHLLHEKGAAIKVAKELHTKIAEELHEGKELVDTSAGAVLSADIKAMEARHKEEMLELKRDMEKANRAKDAELKSELEQEHRELESKLERLQREHEKLRRGLVGRFWNFLRSRIVRHNQHRDFLRSSILPNRFG